MSDTTTTRDLSAAKRALLEARLRGEKPRPAGAAMPASTATAPIPRRAPDARVPLSFAQERFWFIDQLQPGMSAYNLPGGLRLAGALNVPAVERALAELVRRHEVLRTTFRQTDDGTPVQIVAPPEPLHLPLEDLSALPPDAREAAVQRRVEEDAALPFDLASGPVFRPRLLRLKADEHVLLLCMHHIVSDGWSGNIILRDIAVLYEAFRQGLPSPLPELPIQFGDYAVWQRQALAGDAMDRQIAYWKAQMAGAPALLELPADHPRPPVTTARGASVPVIIQPVVLERLRVIGRAEGATLYMVAVAAFAALLGRYAGTDDVVMGAPVAGRARRELEGLIGIFVNTLLLRADLSGDPPFRELVRRVREMVLGGLGHQDVPFERLVAELAPERSLSHAPLFQVAFQIDDLDDPSAPAETATLEATRDGIRVQSVVPAVTTSKFDLTLQLKATFRGITGNLQYSTDLFTADTARRMVRHFVRLLEQVAADGTRRLSDLVMLDDAERARVLEEWNRTDVALADDRPVHRLVEARAAAAPDAPAVVLGDDARTYGELDADASRLARHLRRRGVGPDVRVAVCLPRGPELMTALLAVLKAGGAYVPLDPDLPPARLGWMAADAGAALLLTTEGLSGRVESALPVVLVDGDAARIAAENADPLDGTMDGDNLAYVLYTSGSTGTPKGVAVTHANLRNLCAWYADAYGLTAADRVTQLASPGFDASGFEFWPCLSRGACLDVVPDDVRADPPRLRDWLLARGATQAFAPTPVAEGLLALPWPAAASLRWLHVGGDRLQGRPAAGVPFRVSNDYGPTECTVVASWSVVESGVDRAPDIGQPVHNTRVYVLGPGLQPQPAGVAGELCIGGAQVARGYLGRPALTAERFVPDPFSPVPGARLYRTGDRGRRRDDGVLEALGRLDAQVKLRGFRIEPGEVEALLRARPGVEACAVVVREDAPGDRRLVAYVVGGAEDGDALRAHLRTRLPEYMVPSAIVPIGALPLTPNGKLDRRALPAPERAAAGAGYVAPRTPTEEVLAAIWADVLRMERAGVEDDFFALGGHSLLATRLLTRIRDALGVDVPLRAVFEAPTPATLARRVDALLDAPAEDAAPPLVPVPRDGPLPVSFAQQRLWFIQQMDPRSAAYHLPYALRLRGALDHAVMQRALDALVARHEPLRTVFATRDGEPVQVIQPPSAVAVREEDLRGVMDDGEREAAAARIVRDEAARPFDLAAGPLLRVTVLRLADDETGVLLTLHHVVSDGWSQDVLVRDLSELYAAFTEDRAPVLPDLPVQYADYAAWQRRWLSGAVLERQMDYWRGQLADAPPLLELPADRPRAAGAEARAEARGILLSARTSEGLRALARAEGATLFMVLLAGYQALLSRWSGQDDVVVGTPVAGRSRLEVENLVGFFVNMLALRTDLSADPPFRALVGRVREGVLQAHAHQDVPFEKLVDELQPERSLTHPPLFQAIFSLVPPPREGLRLGGLEASPLAGAAAQAKFDLSLTLMEGADRIGGGLVYRADLFDAATIDRLADHLVRLLDQVAADAELPLSRVALLADEERHRVVEEWNRTDAAYPARSIAALFAEQATRTPEAVALVAGAETVTYGELDARANRLAHHLARRGVGPETRVGLCVERGAGLIVAVLAAVKAGGAYVPLDPDYPAERLAWLLADAGVAVLVTESRVMKGLPLPDALAVVRVDADGDAIAAERADDPTPAVDPDGLAYVMYTSGSTGTPKGVGVTQRNVVRLVRGADYAELGPDETILQTAPVPFDVSTLEIWGALLNGGRLVLMPGRASLDEIAHAIADHGVTTLWLTAGLFTAFVDERLDALGGVRQLLSGGDVVPADAALRVRERWPGLRLINGYGPTENTTFTTCWTVPDGWRGAVLPIGRPVANTRVYVLDAAFHPVPAGLPGELFAGGDGVARGYLGRPALTAERFVPDPFGAPGSRLYRTGDRARWRLDGTLDFLGRLDTQVKIRGFRVEPGEVEAAVRALDGVRDCAVVARNDGGDRRLVAYVVGTADAESVRAALRRTLPEHMVPSAIVPMDALPLTPNGKLHRAALPAPVHASRAEAYVAPRTPAERTMAAIWAEVLRLERVGAHDSFFDAGGHSLLAVRVFARVREAFGVEVPLRALFEHPTLEAFARQVEGIAAPAQPAPEIVARERVETVLAGVEEMSEEELDRLLSALGDDPG